jgi:imidazolonepropionase-like amidohydrolase
MGTVFASQIVALMTGEDNFGTIVPGKRADLILLSDNPLENIANARDIRGVMAAGRWYDEQTISNWIKP